MRWGIFNLRLLKAEAGKQTLAIPSEETRFCFRDLCAQQESNIPMKLQFRQVQLSPSQTKIAKENKGLFLVGGLARLQRKKTKSQYENVIIEALKTLIWESTSVLACLGN